MSVHQMWFGNLQHAQWVPVPRPGMTKSEEGSGELEFETDNGGLWIDDDDATHVVYEMEFPIVDRGYEGIEAFKRYKAGSYGRDFLRFVDPMYQRDNLFAPGWSEPGSGEFRSWKSITDSQPTFTDTPYSAGNQYQYPIRSAVFSVQNQQVGARPFTGNGSFTFLIPPGNTLHLGGAGSLLTADIELRVETINSSGVVSATASLTLQSASSAPAFSMTIPGQGAARIYLTRTGNTVLDPKAQISALWAQIRPTGEAAEIPRHLIGQGHSGMKFRGSSRVDTYVQAFGKKVGASLVLAEVEPWSPVS